MSLVQGHFYMTKIEKYNFIYLMSELLVPWNLGILDVIIFMTAKKII